ncbi:hypothetical protein B4U80_00691 [Leptotrombidium deliense]|uniref:Uncharacterized protein n=1 Tax=Leptotrombidium deliense TaxID=299467 RepID=A0A443RWB3_9ACAR|nr:hypothetical protein B4U80_00691 [Leptotrombidium deliense]
MERSAETLEFFADFYAVSQQ